MYKNNFDGVRISLALIVFFAHVSALTQAHEFKFFEVIFDSNFAVKGFFAISGFLVTQSYLNCHSNLEYFKKRFFRIFPAYATAIFLCVIIGFLVTNLGALDFFKSPQTLKYVLANITFLNFIQPTLPEVFETNPIQALNGSLWTIKVEIMLYVCIPFLIYFFRHFGSTFVISIIFFSSIFWVYFFTVLYEGSKGEELAHQFPGQLSYFALGAYLTVNEKIKNNIRPIALIGLIALFITNDSLMRLIIDPIAYSAIVLYISLAACKSLNLGRYGDISFGIYLYHFPIIQLFIFMGTFEVNAWIGLLACLLATLIMAIASWHLIEKSFFKRSLVS